MFGVKFSIKISLFFDIFHVIFHLWYQEGAAGGGVNLRIHSSLFLIQAMLGQGGEGEV